MNRRQRCASCAILTESRGFAGEPAGFAGRGAVNFPPWKGSTLWTAIVRGMSCGHHGRKIVVARTGGAMVSILKDVVLFSCVTLVVTGIVIAAATLLI